MTVTKTALVLLAAAAAVCNPFCGYAMADPIDPASQSPVQESRLGSATERMLVEEGQASRGGSGSDGADAAGNKAVLVVPPPDLAYCYAGCPAPYLYLWPYSYFTFQCPFSDPTGATPNSSYCMYPNPSGASITANPSDVIIPIGQATGSTTINWSSPVTTTMWPYTAVTVQCNSAKPGLFATDLRTGSSEVTWITPGQSCVFRLYRTISDGGSIEGYNLLASVTVTGRQATPSTFSITPSTVVIPATETTGPFSYSWNAPDYSSLDLWGKVNNGAWQFCCTVNGAGTTGDTIAVGSTYGFRFYPHGSSPQGGTTNLLGSLSVSGVAAPAPTFTMTPTTVIIPSGSTSGPFSYSWNAPGYVHLDLWGKVNSGAWLYCCTVNAVGNTGDMIPVGSTYGFRFYPEGSSPQGGTANLIGSLSVSGVAAPAPTFTMTPTHVIVPPGSTTGPFSYSWNAPGHTSLDLWGKVNNGAWQFCCTIAAAGSSGDNIAVGSTYGFRFYPHGSSPQGGTTNLLGSLSVSASR